MRPLHGIIDEVMASLDNKPIGFDTVGSPFDAIVDTTSYYSLGYPQFTLSTLADGYVFEKPFRLYEGCTVDDDFLTDANWPEALKQIPDPDWNGRPASRQGYMRRIRNYVDMKQRLKDVL